jgi:hypothetical protein
LKEDISRVLAFLPEEWNRSKKQYARLSSSGSEKPDWLGRKYDFSQTGGKAKIEYTDEDVGKLENASESSVLQIRNDSGVFSFERRDGKWIPVTDLEA